MQRANKTINTKVGLDLPMSEHVRQRQVTLNEGKTLVNTKGVYGSKFGNETHSLSFAAIVATRNGTARGLHQISFYIVTCCFNIFTCIKKRVLSPTPHTNSRRRAFARNVESVFIAY